MYSSCFICLKSASLSAITADVAAFFLDKAQKIATVIDFGYHHIFTLTTSADINAQRIKRAVCDVCTKPT